jgi:hypothetical protein
MYRDHADLMRIPFEITAEQRRVRAAYIKRWNLYIGNHLGYTPEDGEEQIIFNYARALPNKIIDFMFGEEFKFSGHADMWPFAQPIIDRIWSGTDKLSFGLNAGQMGGVTGDLFVKVWWDNDPSSVTFGTVQFSVLPSTNVFPTWEPGRVGKDRKMKSCRIVVVENVFDAETGREPKKVYHTYLYTPEVMEEYRDMELVRSEPNLIREIPIVHIQNQPLSNECLGISDIEDLASLQDEINSQASSIAATIEYDSRPWTVMYGIKKEQLKVDQDGIFFLPKKFDGVSIDVLNRQADIRAASEYLSKLKETAHEVTSVPEAALGKMQPISNTSGVALHMQYQPIIHLIKRKVPEYSRGIAELTRLGIKITQLFDQDVINAGGGFLVEVGPAIRNADRRIETMFPRGTKLNVMLDEKDWRKLNLKVSWPNVLPKDKLMEIETVRNLKDLGFIPDRRLLEMLSISGIVSIPVEEVDECVQESRDDQIMKAQVEMMAMYGGGMGGGSYGLTDQTSAGPDSGSRMQSPEETSEGADKEENHS